MTQHTGSKLAQPTLLTAVVMLFFTPLIPHAASADTGSLKKHIAHFQNIKMSKDIKVRGFQVSEGVYMRQAKIAGKYGPGIVVKRKSFAWGINHRGVSISKRF